MRSIQAQPSRLAFSLVLVALLVVIGGVFRWLVTPPEVGRVAKQRAAADRPSATVTDTVAIVDTAPPTPAALVTAPPAPTAAAATDDVPAAAGTAGSLAAMPTANAADAAAPNPRRDAALKHIDELIVLAKAKHDNAELNHLRRLRTDMERGTTLPTLPNPSASAVHPSAPLAHS